ncbi:ATP-binding protein, partial [Mycobacterium gordonae]|uniref:ATP-binding protein n=2 Tax=Mycobacterium TaxID=1763 RepID=UPI0009F6A67B
GVVTVMGAPGIGKSRLAREVAALAAARGVGVSWTFCESHARDIPFGVVARLLRAASGIRDLDGPAARSRLAATVPADADPRDRLLLDDLLGIADPELPLPQVDPDARRRRLTALVNTMSLQRTQPALFIIEDAHWIDAVSESMLGDFLTVISRTPSMVLITYRPEYQGMLARVPGAQTISLAPLGESDTTVLLSELLGADPSVDELSAVIAERAAGNPFFTEEMVRELVQRGVLAGDRGNYVCRADYAEVSVPATVQAAIAARIDRLDSAARQTLSAASVIGAHFQAELLTALGVEPEIEGLLNAELIDQVRFTPNAEYAFHHPLIRTVAYESQLRSDRAEWHRRLAAAIQERTPESVEENAALIAEHLQASGDLVAAYGWHMRAAAWSTNRDLDAARLSWERARSIADEVPGDDPGRLAMRIAPRTMLSATSLRGQALEENRARFGELRELCTAAGDKLSLAIGMIGRVTEVLYAGHAGEASRLASEQTALLESIGEPGPTIGASFPLFCTWLGAGDIGELLRWSQHVIDLADGDPIKGADFGLGSPLSAAIAFRGAARWWLGRPGWRQDIYDALEMVHHRDATSRAGIVAWTYGFAIQYGVLVADDSVIRACEEVVQTAAAAGNDMALSLAAYTLGAGLLNQAASTDRHRGVNLMSEARGMWLRDRVDFLIPVVDVWVGRERARRGDRDAIPVMREAVDKLHGTAQVFYGVWAAGVLIETLLERGTEADIREAEERIDRLTNWWPDSFPDSPVRVIMLLRLRALLARARGDHAYPDLVRRYCLAAESACFEGHLAWAKAMAEVEEQRC